MRDRYSLFMVACVTLGVIGCGKSSESTESVKPAEPPKPAATQDARPTTQALLTGKTKQLPLAGTPLILTVPESWKLDTDGPVTFLLGPSPSGSATIGLSSPGTVAFKRQEIDALISKLPTELATHPEQFRREISRSIGATRVVERRFLKKPVTRNKNDSKGDPIPDGQGGFETVTATPVQWTITVFVPGEQDFARYELNVIDLEADQLAVDAPLLDKVMASLTVQGVAPATTAP